METIFKKYQYVFSFLEEVKGLKSNYFGEDLIELNQI